METALKVTFCAYDVAGNVGGPLSWLLRLLPYLVSQRMEVRVLFLTWDDAGGETLDLIRKLPIQVSAIRCPPMTEDRIRWILERLAECPPDVFVANLVTPAWFAAKWLRPAGIPCVGVLHSDDAFYRGLADEFVFGDASYRISDLVCVSREIETLISAQSPRSTQLYRIPYGVPIPIRKSEKAASELRLAFVGRLAEEQKSISALAKALCRVCREVPRTTAVIYGDGPDRATVVQILDTQGAGPPVRLGGRVPSAQMQEKLLECDVLVLLSDYEGLPIAVLEAMACGCVPVCLRIRSGIPELVEHDVTGLVVEDRGDSVVAAIRRLHGEPGLWERLSLACRARIEAEYSDTVCHLRWAQVLRSIAKHERPKKPTRIPAQFNLPPIHPGLAAEDYRPVTVPSPTRCYRAVLSVALRMRQWLRRTFRATRDEAKLL